MTHGTPRNAKVHVHGPSAWLSSLLENGRKTVVTVPLSEANTVMHTVHHSRHTGRAGLDETLEPYHRLVGELKSMDHVERLVVITDLNGYNGGRSQDGPWKSAKGASLTDERGMASLIVEVLAKSLRSKGKDIVCIRCDTKGHPNLMETIQRALTIPDHQLKSMHDPSIPDLDGWVAICMDSQGHLLGDVSPALWNPHTGD